MRPDLAAPHHVALLALVPGMAAETARTGTLLHGFSDQLGGGHWNEAGHRVAAELIARRLCPTPTSY